MEKGLGISRDVQCGNTCSCFYLKPRTQNHPASGHLVEGGQSVCRLSALNPLQTNLGSAFG